MPKDKQAQEALEKQEASQEASETESKEATSELESKEAISETEEKGFFAKITDKAKEKASEIFSQNPSDESSQESSEDFSDKATKGKPTQNLKLKSILKKGVKFAGVTAFVYKGEGVFTLKIGAYPYHIQSGEAFIVPDDKTATYLRYKEQLFSEIAE